MKIISLRADNVKRLRAVEIKPDGNWVTVSGRNGQGKTSVLDSILWALGGAKNVQSQPISRGKENARIKIALGDKGIPELLVERRFTPKGEYLYVTTPDGVEKKKPQDILNALNGRLTFDPVAFLRYDDAKKLETLRGLVPLEDEAGQPLDVVALDKASATAYAERTLLNKQHESAAHRAAGIVIPPQPDTVTESAETLTQRLATAGTHNTNIRDVTDAHTAAAEDVTVSETYISELEATLLEARNALVVKREALMAAEEAMKALPAPIDTTALLAGIDIARAAEEAERRFEEKTEEKISADADRDALKAAADEKTTLIEGNTRKKAEALARAKMPIEGLGFGEEGVTFNGLPLDQASHAEQLKVSTSIAAAMNPTLKIIRILDGNVLDKEGRAWMHDFAERMGFQIWIELVDDGEGGEQGIVIEDGAVVGQDLQAEEALPPPTTRAEVVASEEPDADARAAAETWLDAQEAKLAETTVRTAVEQLHAQAKIKLARFPDLLSKRWNTAYTARLVALKPKK